MRLREKLSAFKRKKCQKKHLTNQLSYVAAMNYIDSEKKLLDSEKKNFEIKEELLKYKEIVSFVVVIIKQFYDSKLQLQK